MRTVVAGLLAVVALGGCVAVPYGPAPGVYIAPPPGPVYYHGGYTQRHHYHRHHYHHRYR